MGSRDDYTNVMFLEFSKKMMSKGATILGGCCETKPERYRWSDAKTQPHARRGTRFKTCIIIV